MDESLSKLIHFFVNKLGRELKAEEIELLRNLVNRNNSSSE